MPKLSIGMPVYNGEEFIGATLDSILGQSYRDFEIIVSDNASTDRTEQICRQYAYRDERIHYYRNKENIGASDNYNAVFYRASGEYFKWASCNDICHPQFLEKCVAVLDAHPDVVLCYPEVRLFSESIADAEEYHDDLHLMQESPCERYQLFMRSVGLNNVMNGILRTESLHNTAMLKSYFSADIVLMAELVLRGKIYQVDGAYYYRRMDKKSATALKSNEEILKHYFPELDRLLLFQHWKMWYGYYLAIKRSSVNADERRCLRKAYFRMLRWRRHSLLSDVVVATKTYMVMLARRFVR